MNSLSQGSQSMMSWLAKGVMILALLLIGKPSEGEAAVMASQDEGYLPKIGDEVSFSYSKIEIIDICEDGDDPPPPPIL